MKTRTMRVYTHKNVDADAVVGTCCELIYHNIVPTAETVVFVDADTARVPADAMAVDIKAKKHGKGKSYVGYYCRKLLPLQICDEIDEQDSKGKTKSQVPIVMLISALQVVGFTDLEIVKHMLPIVHGWIQLRIQWDSAEAVFDTMPKITIGDYKFIVSVDNDTRGVSNVAQKNGYDGTIFWSEKGCGVNIYDTQKSQISLSHLVLDGWFAHPSGFLFAWGTRKSPKKVPPPQFGTLKDFVEYLKCQEVFYNITCEEVF